MQIAYPEGRARRWLAAAGVLLTGAVFVVDVAAPLDVAAGVLYVLPVLLGLWVTQKAYLPLVAAFAVLLTALDPLLGPPAQMWKGPARVGT